uniref:Glycerophosphocholine acyltransferase 1 n=1 Tax=Ditylum brightwellii TaxID=49249 RepID=A0A7S4SVI4_9STRA
MSNTEKTKVLEILTKIDSLAQRRRSEGFDEIHFTWGVVNCLLVTFVFGALPQHFWLLYLLESFYLFPTRFKNLIRAKPMNQALYYLDFCWIMNFVGVVLLLLLVSDALIMDFSTPDIFRQYIFTGIFGIACGPLLGATAVLPFVIFLFHDVNSMTSLFIHIYPPMLMYTFKWHSSDINEAWPSIFHLNYVDEITFFSGAESVMMVSSIIYAAWFVPYTAWMLLIGIDLPRKFRHAKQRDGVTPKVAVYDTVFHSSMRMGAYESFGKFLWNRPVEVSKKHVEENDFELRDCLVYLMLHAISGIASIACLGYLCFINVWVHAFMILLVALICVYRGAVRYTYYAVHMYSRKIRQDLSLPYDNMV